MNMKMVCVAAVLCLASLQAQIHSKKNADSPAASRGDSDEAALLKLTREWVLAEDNNDKVALRRLYADDFVGTFVDGSELNKDKVIEGARPNRSVWSFTAADYTTKIFGNLGVVTGNGTWKDTNLGQLSFTLVYKKRMPNWQIISFHISKIPE